MENTIEGQDEREHESGDVAGSFSVRHERNQHVCKGACEDEELCEEEKNKTLTLRIGDAAFGEDGVKVGSKDHNTKEDLIGNFDDDIGDQEGCPTVGF